MRLTIERLRTLVLGAGVLLIAALAAFLAHDRYRSALQSGRDLPKRLGIEIQQEANGVTYTQNHAGHALFKIHASKVVQLKDNHAVLHDVKIELYGTDGGRVDRIEGDEFEYDQQAGMARAAGPVEITLMRPGKTPGTAAKGTPGAAWGVHAKGGPHPAAAADGHAGEIHVKTSGLVFNQNSGVATTAERVDFTVTEGTGSAVGATYDSQQGRLVLDRQVELSERRGAETVKVHAEHAEFERGDLICELRTATAEFRREQATAGEAKILFREDGSAVRLDASGGVTLATQTGSRVAAPVGWLAFDEHNRPQRARLEGGVAMDEINAPSRGGRQVHGTAPTADLAFDAQGELHHAHLERGVEFTTAEVSGVGKQVVRQSRKWQSPVADIDFRDAGHGKAEPAAIRGTGGVVVTGESQRGAGAATPSRMAADEVTGTFGPGSVLTTMTGLGHASIHETTSAGTRQTGSGDRLDAQFAARPAAGGTSSGRARADSASGGSAQIESAALDGHVVLEQEPAARAGAATASPMHAKAGHAAFEGAGEWLHLTASPQVDDGGLELTADKIDVSRTSGDAFAHGDVKASWLEAAGDKGGAKTSSPVGAAGAGGAMALGGQGAAHVVADEAQLHQATGEATFHGRARLWQQANSVSAPVIVLDRQRQTLVARSTDAADPVRAVLLSAGGMPSGKQQEKAPGNEAGGDPGREARRGGPAVIRVRGGDLKYSDGERRAVMHAGALSSVTAETGTATSNSDEVELTLLPAGNHAGRDGSPAQVDRMTARGHVVLASGGRRGTGEKLEYSGESGEYVLTGTAAAPPRMTDPDQGVVTGDSLIFHSRDDSVSIEGGGRKTRTETSAPK